jgi:hypothetical protein
VVKNGRYQIQNLPAAIHSGDRIEVCGQPIPEVGGIIPWYAINEPPRDLSQMDNAPIVNEDGFIIETVQLAYFHDLEDQELVLASPAWIITGISKDNSRRFVIFLDAAE